MISKMVFSSWWINQYLVKPRKIWENIEIAATEKRRNYLMSEANYHTTKFFSENLLAIEIKKTHIIIIRFVIIRIK